MTNDILNGQLSPDNEIAQAIETLKARVTKEDGSIDVDELLKAKAHADLQIKRVEGENSHLRTDLDTRLRYQDMVDKLATANAASRDDDDSHVSNGSQNPVVTEDQIMAAAEKVFTKKQQEASQAANVSHVAQELTKVWGPDFVTQLRLKAAELHLSEDYVRQMAADNPRALLAIVLPKSPAQDPNVFNPPASRQNTTVRTSGSQVKNWKYYQALQKQDPKLYNSEAVRKERYDQAMLQGEAFYS